MVKVKSPITTEYGEKVVKADSKVPLAKVQINEPPKIPRPDLPSIWVDTTGLLVRKEPDICTLRFYTVLTDPEDPTKSSSIESCRIQTATAHLRALADIICKTLNYYPKPSE